MTNITQQDEALGRAAYEAAAAMTGCDQPWEEANQDKWIAAAQAAVAAHQAAISPHADDQAVDVFAHTIKAKMAHSRGKGREGWDDPARCSVELLADMFVSHLSKPNPGNRIDLATLAMMLEARGAPDNAIAQAHRAATLKATPNITYQSRVQQWLVACFGEAIAADHHQRNYRFLEEALELVQSLGATRDDAMQLVHYVFNREPGEPTQEVGGVAVTLDALCSAHRIDRAQAAENELERVWMNIELIREKQRSKPGMGPLPGAYPDRPRVT